MFTRRQALLGMAGAVVGASMPLAQAAGKGYPTRPIRCQIGFSAGGATDSMIRIVGEAMAASLGQPIIVENRPGAAGTIATGRVAKAANDGYTLCGVEASAMTISPALYKTLTYDPEADFTFIG